MTDFPLTEQNFLTYAMHHYDNLNCTSLKDLQNDLKHIRYIKRLFNKYKDCGELQEPLILIHLVTFTNMFGVKPGVRMLFYKMDDCHFSQLKTFLLYLSMMPEQLVGVRENVIYDTDIPVDLKIADRLREHDLYHSAKRGVCS